MRPFKLWVATKQQCDKADKIQSIAMRHIFDRLMRTKYTQYRYIVYTKA